MRVVKGDQRWTARILVNGGGLGADQRSVRVAGSGRDSPAKIHGEGGDHGPDGAGAASGEKMASSRPGGPDNSRR